MMMKGIKYLVVGFLLAGMFANAQNDSVNKKDNSKLIISVGGGMAKPGDSFSGFADNTHYEDRNVDISGAASMGYYGKLDLKYGLFTHLSATAMFYSSVNKALNTDKDGKPPYLLGYQGACCTTITSYKYETTSWHTNGLLVGLNLEQRLYFITFNFKFSLGMLAVKSPESHLYYSGYKYDVHFYPPVPGYTFNDEIIQPALIGYNFIANTGIDIDFRITKRVSLKLGWDEFLSQVEISGMQTYIGDSGGPNNTLIHSESQKRVDISRTMILSCINVGVGYIIK